MSLNIDEFLRSIILGRTRPKSVKRVFDKEGPLNIYDFPEFECHIHIHFNDEAREIIGRAEIKSHSGSKLGFVDNQTIAMLRHYAEEAIPSTRLRLVDKIVNGLSVIMMLLFFISGVSLYRSYSTNERYFSFHKNDVKVFHIRPERTIIGHYGGESISHTHFYILGPLNYAYIFPKEDLIRDEPYTVNSPSSAALNYTLNHSTNAVVFTFASLGLAMALGFRRRGIFRRFVKF
jgi:hypothetical protein